MRLLGTARKFHAQEKSWLTVLPRDFDTDPPFYAVLNLSTYFLLYLNVHCQTGYLSLVEHQLVIYISWD